VTVLVIIFWLAIFSAGIAYRVAKARGLDHPERYRWVGLLLPVVGIVVALLHNGDET
jgi:hypothetical protein